MTISEAHDGAKRQELRSGFLASKKWCGVMLELGDTFT